jgi:uncharacterized protein (TIGR01777 family)
MKVFITGGSGLVGTALTDALLRRGDQPIVLSRDARRATERLGPDVLVVEGDPTEYGDWAGRVDGCDGVINLAGEPVFGKRWSDRQKERLRASRIEATTNVVRAIGSAAARPKVLVNASAIGYYGDVPEGELTENSSPGDDFLARTCAEWEQTAQTARQHGVRVAVVRIGVVLARDGGALRQMITPFKFGLGGPVGFGRQWVSWIHLQDLIGVFLAALGRPQLEGVMNATAPQPVRNKEFSKCLARALHRPCLFPVPPFMLRLMFGEVAFVVTGGQKVLPERLKQEGFSFQFADCQAAMNDLFRRAGANDIAAANDTAENEVAP